MTNKKIVQVLLNGHKIYEYKKLHFVILQVPQYHMKIFTLMILIRIFVSSSKKKYEDFTLMTFSMHRTHLS